jgi:hypothetical protein
MDNNNFENNNVENVTYDYSVQENPGDGNKGGNALAIVSLVCGILAVVCCCIPFAYWLCTPLGIAAIVCGIIGLKKGQTKGMCLAGILCGGLGCVLFVVNLISSIFMATSGALDSMF